MIWSNLLVVSLVGSLGAIAGSRLNGHFNQEFNPIATYALIGLPSSILATGAWVLLSRPGSVVIVFLALVLASASFILCLLAGRLSLMLAPFSILATGWVIGIILKKWIPMPSLPALGLVLGLIVIIILWAGVIREYWQADNLLCTGFFSCAWIQALTLEGFRRLLLLLQQ